MAGKYAPHKSRKRSSSSSPLVTGLFLAAAVLVLFSIGLRILLNPGSGSVPPSNSSGVTEPSIIETTTPDVQETREPTTEPQNNDIAPGSGQATIAVTGDILMHLPVINSGNAGGGIYDYEGLFRYLRPYSSAADYSVANLETTLAGNSSGYQYSGYPAFNCPDAITDALREAGFDALLTANNHCYDTGEYGFLRTARTVQEHGLTPMGTRAESSDPRYTIVDLNGIRVGMVCYTYEGQPENNAQPGVTYMNWNALTPKCAELINSFLASDTEPFYTELQGIMDQMKRDGAEATVIYIHWGTEYELTPNAQQTTIAQQLCDMGFDVIVGGHPHVVQPLRLLTSRSDASHKTVCLYSTGNAVSNQRIKEMNLKTGHTEDGVLFSFSFAKRSDGSVYLNGVDLLPCWVDLRVSSYGNDYAIIPLDESCINNWQDRFSLSSEANANAKKSYDRTMAIVGGGLTDIRNWIASQAPASDNPA